MIWEIIVGKRITTASAPTETLIGFCLFLRSIILCSSILESKIHSDPPRVPVYSYHWMCLMEVAKLLPRMSHGQLISPFWYECSHASQMMMKKTYGRNPFVNLRIHRNRVNRRAIWSVFNMKAATAPPGVANQIQKVVIRFQMRNVTYAIWKNLFLPLLWASCSARKRGTNANSDTRPVCGMM